MAETEDDLKKVLIKAYGYHIENDIEIILDKFSAVIASHLFAGSIGSNPLCQLNRALDTILTNNKTF